MALPASLQEELVQDQTLNNPAVIDLLGLSVSFGRRPILKNLRGDLRGKAIGLLGPNGAGKTTLIHTLLGFYEPSAGSARIFGHDIHDQAKQIKSLVGYMPERDSFIAKMSAVHFVRLMGELSGLPPDAALERAHEALFYVGLGEARYRKLETYSLGMTFDDYPQITPITPIFSYRKHSKHHSIVQVSNLRNRRNLRIVFERHDKAETQARVLHALKRSHDLA